MENIIEPCVGCGAILDCQQANPLDSYSFQTRFGDVSGFDSGNGVTLRLQCCQTIISGVIPSGATGDDRLFIVRNLATQCKAIQQFCNGQTTIPGGTGGGGTGGDGGTTQTDDIVWNKPQSCAVRCPDGSLFTYTVRGGLYGAFSQTIADNLAKLAACAGARLNRICLGTFPKSCCGDTAFSQRINAFGPTGQYPQVNLWQIVAGALPTGLTFHGGYLQSRSVLIDGTPTAYGQFSFTVKVTAPNGSHMQRQYSLSVCGVTNTSPLTAYQVGVAYSVDLSAITGGACGTNPLSFQIQSGSLPPGLVINEETGVISGTPTNAASGDYVFNVLVQTGAT